jgi:hypothetical protein
MSNQDENSSYSPVAVHTGGKSGKKNIFTINDINRDKFKEILRRDISDNIDQLWEVGSFGNPFSQDWDSLKIEGPDGEEIVFKNKNIQKITDTYSPAVPDPNTGYTPSSFTKFLILFEEENDYKSTEVTSNFEPLKQSNGDFIITAYKWPHNELPEMGAVNSTELSTPLNKWYEKAFINTEHLIAYLGHHTTNALNYQALYDNLVEQNQQKTADALIDAETFTSKDPKIVTGQGYKDVYFSMQSPLSPLEMSYHGQNLSKPVYGEIKNLTSFGEIKWNMFTQTTDERYLPNLYTYLTVHLDRDIWSNNPPTHPTFKHMLGAPSINLEQLLFAANQDHKKWAFEKQTQQQDLGNTLGTDYFQAYAKAFEVGTLSATEGHMPDVHNKHRNIIFTTDNLDLIKYEEHANIFPTFNRIEFWRDKESEIANALYETGLEKYVLSHIVFSGNTFENNEVNSSFGAAEFKHAEKIYKFGADEINAQGDVGITDVWHEDDITTKIMPHTDFSFILDEYKEEFTISNLKEKITEFNGKTTFVGTGWRENLDDFDDFNFEKSLKALILEMKITSLAKKHHRSFMDIINGKECFSETIAYKIDKYRASDLQADNPVPIQSFYFPNTGDIEKFVYCDTQISYGETYAYRVNAFRLVFGNMYHYPSPTAGDFVKEEATHFNKRVSYANDLYMCLVEVPYYGWKETLQSHVTTNNFPPLPPQVTFLPYRNVNDKLMIRLETSYGEYSDKSINIHEKDQGIFNTVKQSQGVFSQSPVKFKSDTPVQEYEILRIGPDPETGLTREPESYLDFSSAEREILTPKQARYYVDISEEGDENTIYKPYPSIIMGAESNFQLNKIQANKTYYYTFRAREDIGDNTVISNPSAVYKVEMMSDPGKTLGIPRITLHKFKKVLPPTTLKPMQRFLHIKPSLNMLAVDADPDSDGYNPSSYEGTPPLGKLNKKLFSSGEQENRKFKIRLTSKSTGKKIDINVKFKHGHTNGAPPEKETE